MVSQIHRDLEAGESAPIRTANYVSDVADYIGDLIAKESGNIPYLGGPGAELDASATFILGGKSPVTNQSFTWSIPRVITLQFLRTIRFCRLEQSTANQFDRIIRPDTPLETAFRELQEIFTRQHHAIQRDGWAAY